MQIVFRSMHNMQGVGIQLGLFPGDKHRISVRMRFRLTDVPWLVIGLVKIKPNHIILVTKGFQKSFFRIGFNVNDHRPIKIGTQLANQIILEPNNRSLIHKVISGVIENQGFYRVTVPHGLFLLTLLHFLY